MVRSLGLIVWVMVIRCFMVRMIDTHLGDGRNSAVTEQLTDRSHPLQWNCKSKQAHH